MALEQRLLNRSSGDRRRCSIGSAGASCSSASSPALDASRARVSGCSRAAWRWRCASSDVARLTKDIDLGLRETMSATPSAPRAVSSRRSADDPRTTGSSCAGRSRRRWARTALGRSLWRAARGGPASPAGPSAPCHRHLATAARARGHRPARPAKLARLRRRRRPGGRGRRHPPPRGGEVPRHAAHVRRAGELPGPRSPRPRAAGRHRPPGAGRRRWPWPSGRSWAERERTEPPPALPPFPASWPVR